MLQQYSFSQSVSVISVLVMSCMVTGCATSSRVRTPQVGDYDPQAIGPTYVASQRKAHEAAGTQAPSSQASVASGLLSLDACIEIALAHNPVHEGARHGVNSREASVGVAQAPYYPEVSLSSGYSRWQRRAYLPDALSQQGSSTKIGPTHDWMGGITARYTLYDGGRRTAELRRAVALKTAADEELIRVRRDLVYEVQSSFYQLAAATQIYNVAAENLARAETHLDLARRRKEAGAVAGADVVRSEVEVAEARMALTQAGGLRRTLRGRLNVAMGLPVASEFEIDAGLQEIYGPLLPDASKIIEDAMQASPEIKAALNHVSARQSGVAAARSAYHPRFYAEAGYNFHEPDFPPSDREWSVGVGASWTVFSGFARKHEINRAKAELSRQEAEVRLQILQLEQEVWSAHTRVLEMWERIQTCENQVLKALESLRIVRARYEVGVATINDLLDTQTVLARAETNLAEARWNYRIAEAWLDRLWTGGPATRIAIVK